MTATDLSVDSKIIAGLITYLDGIRDEIGGYSLIVHGYHFQPGAHELSVTLFCRTIEEAQAVANTLGVTFARYSAEAHPNSYDAFSEGIRFGFVLSKDIEEYPETIAPVTGGHDE